jgi:hypothetical protein
MSAKTVFIVIISVVVTIILMNNTDEVTFWIFGEAQVPKLAVLGVMFGLGLIVGFIAGRPRKKPPVVLESNLSSHHENEVVDSKPNPLSHEDRDYIK